MKHLAKMCGAWVLAALLAVVARGQTTVRYYDTGEEFAGPFASWKNVVKDFGAKGDGVTDDTAAITAGLNALKNRTADGVCVLYFPSGHYRITGTLKNTGRVQGDDYSGMTLIGADPATTSIVFDGAVGASMLELDGWEIKVSRLTLDGKSKAGNGILRDGSFSTYSEFSDIYFNDLRGQGIQLAAGTNGQAEVAILRCHFIDIGGIAVFGPNQNTMDEYIWNSLFQDCNKGIAVGGWHAVGNVFLRSKTIDLGQSWEPDVIMNNISIDGAKFCATSGNIDSAIYIGNKVYNSKDLSGDQGLYCPGNDIYLDNTFACPVPLKVLGNQGNHIYIGNTLSLPYVVDGTCVDAENKIVAMAKIPGPGALSLPAAPADRHRAIFEVKKGTGDDAGEFQKEIDAACTSPTAGQDPIVHLPKGVFTLKTTVTVPANKPLMIVGDAASEYGTVLRWGGKGAGPGLRFLGPSRVTMRDLQLAFFRSAADCVEIDNADQVGGRIYCEQVFASGDQPKFEAKYCFKIDGVENSDVIMVDGAVGYSAKNGAGVWVKGGPDRAAGGNTAKGQAYIMFGGWGNTFNLFDVVDGGRLVAMGARDETVYQDGTLINLTPASRGQLTVAGMSWAVKPTPDNPICNIDGFHGEFNFFANSLLPGVLQRYNGSIFLRIAGDGGGAKVMCCASDIGWNKDLSGHWKDSSDPGAQAEAMACMGVPDVKDKASPAALDTKAIIASFAQLRALRVEVPREKPAGVTDVRLLRIRAVIDKDRTGFTFTRGPAAVATAK